MPRVLLLLLLIFHTSSLFSIDNEFYIKPQSQWVEQIDCDTTFQLKDDNNSEGGSYLLLDFQNNVQLQESYRHYVLRIEDQSGIQNYSDLWFNYDPSYQQLIFHKLIIRRGGKEINRLKKSDFKIVQNETELERKIYSGNYSAGINIEDVQVGDIIEYSFTIKGENPIFDSKYFDSFNLNYTVPVKKYVLKLIYPKDRKINYKLINTDLAPQSTSEANNISLKWLQVNIAEVVLNSDLPSWYNAFAQVQFSEFETWSDVTKWSYPLYPEVDIKNTALENKLNELIADQTEIDAKINTLLRFVQEEIRYVGIEVNEYSHKPHNPIEVYNKRFGDCKDKAYLLVTLLRKVGIEAYPAYVNTLIKGEISDRLPSPIVFDHVIVAIPQNYEMYFVDPTMSNQRGDFKSIYNGNYKMALVLYKDYGEVSPIPSNSTEKIVIHERFEVSDTIAATKYSISSTYFGSEADAMRGYFKSKTTKELEQNYLSFYDLLYPKMRIIEPIKMEDNAEENIVHIEENYEIEDFWTFDDSETVNDYVSEVNAVNLKSYISMPSQKNRSMPFAIYYPIEIENKIEFVHSKDINVEEINGKIANTCFQFTYEVKTEGNTVVFNYNFKSYKSFVTVAEMDQYYKDVDEIANLVFYTFTYGNDKIDNEAGEINWLMIVLLSFFSIILIFVATILYKRDVEVKSDKAKSLAIGGWLVLPAIGVCAAPLILIFTFISAGLFDQSTWSFISSADSIGFNLLWSIAFLNELLINTILLVYSVFLIVLLFKKRTIFPIHYIFFRSILIVFLIIDAILLNMIDSAYYELDKTYISEISKSVLGSLIWIPYMLRSERVKDTFSITFKAKKTSEIIPENELLSEEVF